MTIISYQKLAKFYKYSKMKKNMNKIFISYKYTGLKREEVDKNLKFIRKTLENLNFKVTCPYFKTDYFEENNIPYGEIIKYGFNELESSDICLFFINHEEPSSGMLMEAGFCEAKNIKKIILNKKDIYSYIESIAELKIEYENLENIPKLLSQKLL